MTQLATNAGVLSPLTPPASKDALIAEYIGHILSGTPFPAHLRAPTPTPTMAPVATAREGIERILRGGA